MYWRKDSHKTSEQLVAWQGGNLWRYTPFVADMTGLIISAEYNTQPSLAGVPGMAMARVKPIAINFAMFVNPFATSGVKNTQIHSWWYEEITRIDPAQSDSDPPHACISMVNESSQ